MSEAPEIELARKAKRRLVEADHPLLLIGLVVLVVGCIVIVRVDPWVDEAGTGIEYLRRLWATAIGAGIVAIGAGMMGAGLKKPDMRGSRSIWFIVASSIPFFGGAVQF